MSLRLRLLAAMTTVLVLLLLGGAFVVRSQEAYLIGQIDDQLAAAMPFAGGGAGVGVGDGPGQPDLPGPGSGPLGRPAPEAPISRLFVAVVADGELIPLLQGQLLEDVPAAPTAAAELEALADGAVTVDGVDEGTRFRVRATPVADGGEYLLVALPLDEADSAIRRLQLVLGVVGLLVLLVMAAAVWWVERLGIHPISRVTEAAEAISAGDRSQRVHGIDEHTEAGKLAHAFNLMLDDRDAVERERRQFVADASHELRTPLTSIRGYLDLYGQGRFSEPEQVDDMVRRMTRESSRMKDLVEDLLLLANLDQQRPLRSDRVDVNQLLTDAANDAGAVQPQRSIVVDVPDEPVELTGDLHRLQQVVGALVDNALTHTGREAELRLSARNLSADDPSAGNFPGGGVELVVADDGPGLDADTAARVFDRFFRVDDSRSRRTGNFGLGLAITRSIVEAHGGTIRLDTAPGAGCTFTINLPR